MGVKKRYLWDMVGAFPVCGSCGSKNIVRDAIAVWHIGNLEWQLRSISDHFTCDDCGSKATPDWGLDEGFRKARICRLNDLLRQGHAERATIVITEGVRAGGDEFVRNVVAAVGKFDNFSDDNDPYGEHDFGSFELAGERLFFKIDYFDLDMKRHSDDAANPAATHRVLTIMLASEY